MLTPQEKCVGGGALLMLAFCIGVLAGCDCLACEPTGYAKFADTLSVLHGERPIEFGAGLQCEFTERTDAGSR
ncbi:hypothetical protein [Methylococcus capsulatus]|uniref:Conserved domain protein n=1 Tax=Methylococcus capsulatus (strain ATCC 33009 / NCIMB 11132 / Bath) TaxID=243233 RepID=Q602X0_METCA|nr:hypothetical protein [Methylococcus capsulatus]AAU90961.1 conserved domain protein [Methylococcus capsulatus str. Bath]QXP93026.1 hypothetical protein KW113_11735 [Methylococcus capsulatus]